MSGGPIHAGLGDTITVARIRPEASTNAARHLGRDMGDIFVTAKKTPPRPSTAPGVPRPLPGFEVTGQRMMVARVKPEAAEIALRSRGSMSGILAQDYSKPRVQMGERPRTAPQQPIKGPIGQGPIQAEQAPSRVKPEASKTAQLATQGLVGRLLATSVDEARRTNIEQALKSPPREKNHVQKNIQRMRRIQRAAREKQQTSPTQPLKALWRSEKYEHIESRVGPTTWQKKPTPNAPRPNTAPTTNSSSTQSSHRENSNKINFVARNAKKAFSNQNKLRRSRSSEELRETLAKSKHGQSVYDLQVRGTVPDYLVKRQEQWKEQERENEANKPDPDCPKGHKRVPEDERRKVLAKLKKSQDELEIELGSLPVRQCDTLKYKQRKMDIEVKLNELDEAVKIFSKKKVFVRVS